MRPEKITLPSKKSKSVQAGSSPFKIYLSNRGIVADGQMVDVGEMDSLIVDHPFPGTRRDVKSKELQMRIWLFIPCYIDAFFPKVGIATLELLQRFGHDVDYRATRPTATASRWSIVVSASNAPIQRCCSYTPSPASTTSSHRPPAASTTCATISAR
jgi:hypothetical protein